MKYQFHKTCVDMTIQQGLRLKEAMDNGRSVGFETIRKRLDSHDLQSFKESHGYTGGGVKMENDPCVSYARIKWEGRTAYVIIWSAIEYLYMA